jgi:hypothetical protein
MFKRGTGSKYGAKKTVVDGVIFDSKVESKRYEFLKGQLRLGEISNLELQPRYQILDAFRRNGKAFRKAEYIPDFRYANLDGVLIIEDVKGLKTPVYELKIKMFLAILSDKIEFHEVYWKAKQWEIIKK